MVDAQALITICPFCHIMYDTNELRIEKTFNEVYGIPILHYPQLLGLAMGMTPEELAFNELRVNASKILKQLTKEQTNHESNKLKIAFYWAASCGGCEIAVLDLNEKILDVVKFADIVFWPVAIDVKYKDVEALPDKHIDITFFNGSIRNSEQEHMAKVLRAKIQNLSCFWLMCT